MPSMAFLLSHLPRLYLSKKTFARGPGPPAARSAKHGKTAFPLLAPAAESEEFVTIGDRSGSRANTPACVPMAMEPPRRNPGNRLLTESSALCAGRRR